MTKLKFNFKVYYVPQKALVISLSGKEKKNI